MLQGMSKMQDELDAWVAEVGGPLKVHGYQATASNMGFLAKVKRSGTSPFVRLGATKDKKGQRQLFRILSLSAAQRGCFGIMFFRIYEYVVGSKNALSVAGVRSVIGSDGPMGGRPTIRPL